MITRKGIDVKGYKDQVVQKVYTRYQELIVKLAMQWISMTCCSVLPASFRNTRSYATSTAQRFEHILVDEFQDTNLPSICC